MNYETIISIAIGVIIGGIITWIFTYLYYKRAGEELRSQSKKLKLTSDLIIYKLQYPDAKTEIVYDSNGEVTGWKVII